jgi:preprotein translocase subunit SecA
VLQAADEALRADREALEAKVQEVTEHYRGQCETEKKEVLAAGGLHILGTERHESRRIDNQLRGRAGRQGDPGSSRFFLSLEDDLMRIFAGERVQMLMDRLGMEEDVPIEHPWVTRAVENAQKKVEERNFDIRKHLLEYDDVMNQQRKSIYTLRRQVLMGQYRTVPTDDELEKGVTSQPVVEKVDESLVAIAKPMILQLIKHYAAPAPDAGLTEEELRAHRESVQSRDLAELETLRIPALEQNVYMWFGCQVPLVSYAKDPKGAYDLLVEEVGMSLSEQQERLLDLTEDLVTELIEEHCPPKKHYEDWDLDKLASQYEEQFGISASGITGVADPLELAERLYADAEAVLLKKEADFGAENFLRLFRNLYMQEIDRQWIEHLQGMDSLRDGIGLRGYGQRDPKREYKREGYTLFMQMMRNIKGAVANKMFLAQRVTEQDLVRQEEQRRKTAERRLNAMRTQHPGATGGDGAAPAGGPGAAAGGGGAGGPNRRQRRRAAAKGAGAQDPVAAAPPPPQSTVRREGPKLGRNDPCHCGSGKKYKNCHLRQDQAAAEAP